MSLVKTR